MAMEENVRARSLLATSFAEPRQLWTIKLAFHGADTDTDTDTD